MRKAKGEIKRKSFERGLAWSGETHSIKKYQWKNEQIVI